MVIGPLASAARLSAAQLLRLPEAAPLSTAEAELALRLRMAQLAVADEAQQGPSFADESTPDPRSPKQETVATLTAEAVAPLPAARTQVAQAPALPPAEPAPPSATLLALAREPGALPRQWQLEISTQPHAAPVMLQAQRQPAEPGWALRVQLAQAAPVHQEKLALRLARGGVAVSALQVSTDAAVRGIHTFAEGGDDEPRHEGR